MTTTLTVWHAPAVAVERPPSTAPRAAAWHVSTCQRELRIFADAAGLPPAPHGFESFQGVAAYEFLLRVATGLESAVRGETNVLGQLRSSWAEYDSGARPSRALAAVARALFEDAALVRSRHLQGIGGNSYGTLARMLLKPQRGARILLIGAGALARSVLPAFAGFERAVHTRGAGDAPLEAVRRFGCGTEQAAIEWARFVCFCIPPHTERDACWLAALAAHPRPTLHLGVRRGTEGAWGLLPGLRTLDDLFDLQRSQSALRSARLARAALACREFALRRVSALIADTSARCGAHRSIERLSARSWEGSAR